MTVRSTAATTLATDVLVVGGGLAALRAALERPPGGRARARRGQAQARPERLVREHVGRLRRGLAGPRSRRRPVAALRGHRDRRRLRERARPGARPGRGGAGAAPGADRGRRPVPAAERPLLPVAERRPPPSARPRPGARPGHRSHVAAPRGGPGGRRRRGRERAGRRAARRRRPCRGGDRAPAGPRGAGDRPGGRDDPRRRRRRPALQRHQQPGGRDRRRLRARARGGRHAPRHGVHPVLSLAVHPAVRVEPGAGAAVHVRLRGEALQRGR